MNKKKIETFIYQDFGFPIKLINVPMKKIFGEWFLDINLSQLQKNILNLLIHKQARLTGAEIRFIRKYFEMTTTQFGLCFGATHAAVLKWEKEESLMNPTTELCIRLYVFDRLLIKDKEFRKFYHTVYEEIVSPHKARRDKIKHIPIEIDANNELFAIS